MSTYLRTGNKKIYQGKQSPITQLYIVQTQVHPTSHPH